MRDSAESGRRHLERSPFQRDPKSKDSTPVLTSRINRRDRKGIESLLSLWSEGILEKGRRRVSPERAAKFAAAFGHPPNVLVRLALQDAVRASALKLKVIVEAA